MGAFKEDGTKLYAKIILRCKNKKDVSQKVWCSCDKRGFDFSKEVFLKLNKRQLTDCSISIQLKKSTPVGAKSKTIKIYHKTWHFFLLQMMFLVKLILALNTQTKAFNTGRKWWIIQNEESSFGMMMHNLKKIVNR